MNIVVSDTNVFVALHKCDLLIAVFSNTRVQVSIPTEIYEELTGAAHRVSKEYPELSAQIRTFRHNPNHGQSISLEVRDHKSIDDISAMTAFYELDREATLDRGEREAIPLAIQLSATFLSCDHDAVDEHLAIANRNNSTAAYFEDYCAGLKQQGIISASDLERILTAIRE